MFWKYTIFETKLLIRNRKNWFIASFLLLFYFVFFIYYSQVEPPSLIEQKRAEKEEMNAIFEHVDYLREDIPDVAEVYEILLKESSLLNFQVFYLGIGDDPAKYIENSLELNRLRLEVHNLGNKGIPEHLIKSKDEILKENALLHYIKDHHSVIETESFATNHYFTNAMNTMSGLLLLLVVLICGSELLLTEQRHQSVVRGFPISFMKKVTSKVLIHFAFLYTFLVIGFLVGAAYIVTKLETTDFSFPILIYQNGNYAAVSTLKYLILMFIGLAVVTLLLLYFSILLNMLIRNAFANILLGLGLFVLPDLLLDTGIQASFLHPLKYLDIGGVLSGNIATKLGSGVIDYSHALFWLSLLTCVNILIIYLINSYMYVRKPKDRPLSKAY
ncbi:hypothetical protein [Robertmurraya sp. Marseille-Q9965]